MMMPGKGCRAHAIAAGLAALMAACGGSGTPSGPSATGSSSNSSGAGVTPGSAVFSQSPIDVAAVSTITPIGNLNPPDHTLPTNHAYFFHPSAAGAMDLGIVNNAVTLFFARPDRYIPGTLHADSPFKYFAEPVRSQLYARVAAADKDGRISFDQTGTLAGNWFTPDLAPAVTENFG